MNHGRPEGVPPQACPFCGAAETDRLETEGRRVLVFACMFSPTVDPALPEEAIGPHLRAEYASQGGVYFQRQCDRLHYFVMKGQGHDLLESRGHVHRPPPPTAPPGA